MTFRVVVPAVVVALLALTGCSSPSGKSDSEGDALPVQVTLEVAATGLLYIPASGNYCKGYETGIFHDIHKGTKVLIEDASGKTLTTGSLSEGTPSDDESECTFGATVFVKPTGDHFYRIEIPGHGSLQFSDTDLWSSSTTLVLDAGGSLSVG